MFDSCSEPSGVSGPQSSDLSSLAEAAPPSPAPVTARLRSTRDPRRLDTWALALTSRGMSPLIRWTDGSFELHVLHERAAAAETELQATEEEERETQRAALADAALTRPAATRHWLAGAVLIAVLLLGFFAVTGPRTDASPWFSAGASDAERVLAGEWWRAVTALTLHGDGAHVLGNIGIGTLVVGAVMRSEGIGWGAALVLASGTTGNLLNAWAHQTLHRSVGFSTAVFGAIGLLGGLAYVQGRRSVRSPRPAWTALAGSVALLALLGTSEKSTVDLLAHLFGALAGVTLGVVVAWTRWRPSSALGQALAALGVALTVVGSWWLALA